MNLAIDTGPSDAVQSSTAEPVGGLLMGTNGELHVRAGSQRNFDFGWSKRGERTGDRIRFDLEIPPAIRGTMELAVPPGFVLDSSSGILHERLEQERGEGFSWMADVEDDSPKEMKANRGRLYRIDVGGKRDVKLEVRRLGVEHSEASDGGQSTEIVAGQERGTAARIRMSTANAASAVIIRRIRTQYELDPQGIRWTQRLTIETPRFTRTMAAGLTSGFVESVEVESVPAPFELQQPANPRSGAEPLERQLEIDLESVLQSFVGNRPPVLAVTIVGREMPMSYVEERNLPQLNWEEEQAVKAIASEQVQLKVIHPYSLRSVRFPKGWEVVQSQDSDLHADWFWRGRPLSRGDQISVSLVKRAEYRSAETNLRLTVGTPKSSANVRMAVPLDRDAITPLRIQVQPGWSLESISFPNSGRLLSIPVSERRKRTQTVWPEELDLDGALLTLDLSASTSGVSPTNLQTSAAWVARLENLPSDFAATIEAPGNLVWSDQSLMKSQASAWAGLSPGRQGVLGEPSSQRLFFDGSFSRVPQLRLSSPPIDFEARVDVSLLQDEQDTVESIVVRSETKSNSNSLRIRVDANNELPEYRWFAVDEDSAAAANGLGQTEEGNDRAPAAESADDSVNAFESDLATSSIPSSRISRRDDGQQSVVVIDLEGMGIQAQRIIGVRRYPTPEVPTRLFLPAVLRAQRQEASVRLGGHLKYEHDGDGLIPVPLSIENTGDGGPTANITRLRYDAGSEVEIEIEKSEVRNARTDVWSMDVRLTASSHGDDQIEAVFVVKSDHEFDIHAP
ncbi:MAG: hypothetical protein AAF989_15835, partial [Planctomycetota bacterium]